MKLILSALLFAFPLCSFAANQISGVGMLLTEKDHKIFVGNLVAGAPAAREGAIHPGDQIISVKPFDGSKPGWLPADQLQIDELVQLIRGESGTTVRLHLGNAHGQYEVALTRETFDIP